MEKKNPDLVNRVVPNRTDLCERHLAKCGKINKENDERSKAKAVFIWCIPNRTKRGANHRRIFFFRETRLCFDCQIYLFAPVFPFFLPRQRGLFPSAPPNQKTRKVSQKRGHQHKWLPTKALVCFLYPVLIGCLVFVFPWRTLGRGGLSSK